MGTQGGANLPCPLPHAQRTTLHVPLGSGFWGKPPAGAVGGRPAPCISVT